MLIAILLIGAVALGWPLVLRSSPKKDTRPTGAGVDRRMRWVERHPGEVNSGDIERVLTSEGLCLADARLVSEKAFALGTKPFTMWMFIKTYGARELAVAVVAEVAHDRLLEHLADGSLPNFAELEVFASLNGLVAASDRSGKGISGAGYDTGFEGFEFDGFGATTPEPASHGPHRSPADLDIHEPGDWDGLPDNLASFEVPSDEPVRDMDFGDWEFGDGRSIA